jgi:hypothetical protein
MTLGHDGHLSDEQQASNRYAAAQSLDPGRSQQKTKHPAILERMQRDRPIAGAATGWSSDLLPGAAAGHCGLGRSRGTSRLQKAQQQRVSITFEMVDESGGRDQAAPSTVQGRVMATLSPSTVVGVGLVRERHVGDDAVCQYRLDLVSCGRVLNIDLGTDSTRARTSKQSFENLGRSGGVLLKPDVCGALASIESDANARPLSKVVSPPTRGRYHQGAVWLFMAGDGHGVASAALAAGNREEREVLAGQSVESRSQQCDENRIYESQYGFRRPGVLDCGAIHAATFSDRIPRRKARLRRPMARCA